jgi:hypothetical protein
MAKSKKGGTYWLSLSTKWPKLSRSSIVGTPASSEGHRGVEGSDMSTNSQRAHAMMEIAAIEAAHKIAKRGADVARNGSSCRGPLERVIRLLGRSCLPYT